MPINDTESFYSLIAEKKYEIVIPMIQRDYAQGRTEEGEVRNEFLSELKNYIDSDKRGNNLDFIYGHVEENELVVLDGQQRLTTLFLLHWYSAVIGGKTSFDSFKEWMFVEQHSCFSYHTRDSAKEFCDALVSFTRKTSGDNSESLVDKAKVNIENFGKIDWKQIDEKEREEKKKEARISSFIRNEKWFLSHWNEDPTILSMLNMIDAIEDFFPLNEYQNLYNKLCGCDGKDPIITFLYMDLDKYKLTDTLYIKMNSRGRPLTRFENLKVKLLNIYKDPKRQEMAIKFDGKWTDIFWSELVSKNEASKNVFSTEPMDEMWLRFISVLCCNYYAAANVTDSKSDEIKERIKEFTDADLEPKIEYSKILTVFETTDLKNDFENILDLLIEKNDDDEICNIKNHLLDTFYYDIISEFRILISENKDYYNRLRFHAYYKYLLTYGAINLAQWMRYICNVINNTTIDKPEEFAKALATIEKVCISVNGNTFEYLKNEDVNNVPHNQLNLVQIKEEKIKIILSISSEQWKAAIEKAEKEFVYFSGKKALHYPGYLTFPLEYSKISLANIEHDAKDNDKLNTFISVVELLTKLFPNVDGSNCETALIRSLLSIGNYLNEIDENLHSASFLMNNHRDLSWKRYIASEALNKSETGFFVSLVKRLLPIEKEDSIEEKLETVCSCSVSTEDWRDLFIQNPRLLNGYKEDKEVFIDNHRVIRFDSNRIFCFQNSKKGQYNHLHSELNSLCDYVHIKDEFVKEKLDLSPYKKLWYNQVKDSSNEGFGFWLFMDLKNRNIGWDFHRMNIFIFCSFESSETYRILISNWNKDKQIDITDEDLLRIFEALNYEKDSENNYALSNISREDLETKLEEICSKFRNLQS